MKDWLFQFIRALLAGKKAVPPQFQKEFSVEFNRVNLQSTRILSSVAAILVPATIPLDYFMCPGYLARFLIVRSIMSAFCIFVIILSYIRPLQRFSTVLTMLSMIAVGSGIAYMIRVLGYETPYYAGLNLIYLALMLTPWGIVSTLICCLTIYSLYLVPIFFFDGHALNTAMFMNNNIFQIWTIVIASVVNYFQSKRRSGEIINRLTIAAQARELEQLDKYKREFIANVTHELKTPLAIVMGNAELIANKQEDEELRQGLERIGFAAAQLANHVDRIISVANVDDPDVKMTLGNYDYAGIVQNVFSVFETRAYLENITYVLNPAPGPLVVNLDVVCIEEVLNNLLQNAFKFTPAQGIITVTISTDGEKVYTEVSDSGVGIPKDKIDRIFDRLYQADEVLSKRQRGMGLGLYICKKNIENHGGEITVHSSQGKGTSFRFSLPLYVDQSVRVKNSPYTGRERRGKAASNVYDRRSGVDRRSQDRLKLLEYQQRMGLDDLARMTFYENVREYEDCNPTKPTVLILEDNPGMMKVIVEALREDYNLLLGMDAFEGWRKLEDSQVPVALILSDIMMPGMNGFDFCERIMARKEFRHIPLIFITALMNQADQLRGFSVGATDYIVKPYNVKILKEKVDHWIARRQYETLLKEASQSIEKRMEQMSKVKDIILHEINNPMQIIMAASYFVDRLRCVSYDNASDEEKRLWKSVQTLQQGIDGLMSVLETTKQFDVNGLSMRRPEFIGTILDEAIKQTRHILGGVELDLPYTFADEVEIDCDKRMIIQVLINIIRNGAEAISEKTSNEQGRISISYETTDNGYLLLKLRDNGIGMDEEVLDRLFRFRFTTKKDGTGIGLHLSKMILKLHNGSIQASSKEGIGTTFTIRLPMYKKEGGSQQNLVGLAS